MIAPLGYITQYNSHDTGRQPVLMWSKGHPSDGFAGGHSIFFLYWNEWIETGWMNEVHTGASGTVKEMYVNICHLRWRNEMFLMCLHMGLD